MRTKKKLGYVFVGIAAVLFVAAGTVSCAIIGLFFGVVINNTDQSWIISVTGVGAVVGFCLAIAAILMFIKSLQHLQASQESL